MSKNITIKEGGTGRNFTAKKLRTDLQGGGSCLWVPEDEVKLITKRITKPGEYNAADEPVELGEPPIYGYEKVIVSGMKTDAETKLITKSITENGSYSIEDEPEEAGVQPYGYSRVYVNVAGGGKYIDPDTGTTVYSDPSPNPGSAITGKDKDGDDALHEIDDDGNIKETKLADHILIDTPPNKLSYMDGEPIDITGAVVRGYLKNGTPYKNASYAESIITHNNLIISPSHADASQGGEGGASSDLPCDVEYPLKTTSGFGWYLHHVSGQYIIDNYIDFACPNGVITSSTSQNGVHDAIFASSDPNAKFTKHTKNIVNGEVTEDVTTDYTLSRSYTYNGKTVYYGTDGGSSLGWNTNYGFCYSGINIRTNYAEQKAWTMVYGEKEGGTQQIGIGWARDGDAKVLHAYFDIEVTPSNA